MESLRHIAIAGNIGAGKTTLADKLSAYFGWDVLYEDVDHNPYLSDFYENMHRWSFNLQIYFLNSRISQIRRIQEGSRTVVQDRTVYEDAHIFAPNLYEMGLMSSRDFENYHSLFKTVTSLIAPPDLLIYLRASLPALMRQIRRRGRDYENNIRQDYLQNLNNHYETWINNYTDGNLLIINVDDLNFVDSLADFDTVATAVAQKITQVQL
ncbi:MAG: deoxynucleoside kinase [Sphingobacteriales bacterium]|nr:deoxynucleoside kinase [Sphingobacteriales bacterium]